MNKTLPLLAFCLTTSLAGADWREFRGPGHQGHSAEKGLPTRWGATENVRWKVKLPGPGASSPIVVGDRVFVTSFTGKKAESIVRILQCYDRKTGKLLWEQKRPAPQPENDYAAQLTQHGFTTSTPCSDGEKLYVSYGRGGLFCFDLDGNEKWHADMGKGLNTFGSGSSPTLFDDLVLVNACTEAGGLLAFDKHTGKRQWRTKLRGDAWASPVIVTLKDGRREIVLNAEDGVYGIDPKSGDELWYCETVGGYVSSTPLVAGDILYVTLQSKTRATLALRAGGKGDVTKSHVLWKNTSVGASYCSPLLIGNRLYLFSGQAIVLDTATGKEVNRKRLEGINAIYGSPIHADGHIYLFTRHAGAHVLSADESLKEISLNVLGDATAIHASPAASHGCLFIRTNEHLFCLGRME